MSDVEDLRELVAVLAGAFDVVADDLVSLAEIGADLWPPKIVEAMEREMALTATMKRAVELAPDHAAELRALYVDELESAHWDEAYVPPPVLPETREHLEKVREFMRRKRILDRDLDLACKDAGTAAEEATYVANQQT